MSVKKVYLIFKTHLDIGYTDYAENVKEKYLTRFVSNNIAPPGSCRARTRPLFGQWAVG